MTTDYPTRSDLLDLGYSPEEIDSLDPAPTEYTALGGEPCYSLDQIEELLGLSPEDTGERGCDQCQ